MFVEASSKFLLVENRTDFRLVRGVMRILTASSLLLYRYYFKQGRIQLRNKNLNIFCFTFLLLLNIPYRQKLICARPKRNHSTTKNKKQTFQHTYQFNNLARGFPKQYRYFDVYDLFDVLLADDCFENPRVCSVYSYYLCV